MLNPWSTITKWYCLDVLSFSWQNLQKVMMKSVLKNQPVPPTI